MDCTPDRVGVQYCASCGTECDWKDIPARGPCEGQVEAVDETTLEDGDYAWVHLCRAHAKQYWSPDEKW